MTKAMRMADQIEAGTVYINNFFNAAIQSLVVGFKQSGYGRENGWEGCAACSGRCGRGPAPCAFAARLRPPATASFRAVRNPVEHHGSPRATDRDPPLANGSAAYR